MFLELTLGFISSLWESLGEMESGLDPLKEGVFSINGNIAKLNNDTQNVSSIYDDSASLRVQHNPANPGHKGTVNRED